MDDKYPDMSRSSASLTVVREEANGEAVVVEVVDSFLILVKATDGLSRSVFMMLLWFEGKVWYWGEA